MFHLYTHTRSGLIPSFRAYVGTVSCADGGAASDVHWQRMYVRSHRVTCVLLFYIVVAEPRTMPRCMRPDFYNSHVVAEPRTMPRCMRPDFYDLHVVAEPRTMLRTDLYDLYVAAVLRTMYPDFYVDAVPRTMWTLLLGPCIFDGWNLISSIKCVAIHLTIAVVSCFIIRRVCVKLLSDFVGRYCCADRSRYISERRQDDLDITPCCRGADLSLRSDSESEDRYRLTV